MIKIFLRDANGHRPLYGSAGQDASHQTGWTGIVAKLIQQYGEYQMQNRIPQEDGEQ